MGQSLRLNSPAVPLVCIVEGELAESDRAALQSAFTEVVMIRPEHAGLGWQVKNVLMDYSPFDHTLFLDSDCLILQDLRPAFAVAGQRDVAFATKAEPEQEKGAFLFAKINLAHLKRHFQVDWWPQILGGGHFFFRKTSEARKIFGRALDWSRPEMLSPFGWTDFRRGAPDELTLQMALSETGHGRSCALVEYPLVCWTPWENARPDVFRRRVSVRDRTTGVRRWREDYLVAHFGGEGLQKCSYRRELWRLAQASRLGGAGTQRMAMNLAMPVYHSFAHLHNLWQRILGRLLPAR